MPEHVSNCRDKNILKPVIFAFLTGSKADGLHVEACPLVPREAFDNPNDDLLGFRMWCEERYWPDGPLLNVHAFLLWLIFQRKLVKCPDVLRPEFRDAP